MWSGKRNFKSEKKVGSGVRPLVDAVFTWEALASPPGSSFPPLNPQGLRASLDKARATLLDILESKTRSQSTW